MTALPAATTQQIAELKRLRTFIQHAQGSMLLFALYRTFYDIDAVMNALGSRESRFIVRHDDFQFYTFLETTDPQEDQVFSVVLLPELRDQYPDVGLYADLNRERLRLTPYPVIVWLPEESAPAFIKTALNFWAWNSGGFFDFAGMTGESEPRPTTESSSANTVNYGERFEFLQGLPISDLLERVRLEQERVLLEREKIPPQPERLALALATLGLTYAALGRREDALQATQEATNLYRSLAQRNPDTFTPDLAASLNNLGIRLSELGRREDALQATQEATNLYRTLAQHHPDTFTPDLAMSLNNLGARLSALGRREDALQATQEATNLYRSLAQHHPDTFIPDLAMSLNNLGSDLSALGRREDALQATQEAVDLRRQLAQHHPDTFTPDLARSLNNLGDCLKAVENIKAALPAYAEAVRLIRPFAQQYPAVFDMRLQWYRQDYLAACNQLGMAPEPELIKD